MLRRYCQNFEFTNIKERVKFFEDIAKLLPRTLSKAFDSHEKFS